MRIMIVAVAVFLSAAILPADDPKCPPNYGYCGFVPPEQWSVVSATCGSGKIQSPITLDHRVRRNGEAVRFHYQSTSVTVTNSGHDFRAVLPATTTNTAIFPHAVAPGAYTLQNFHFHTPSEHELLPGRKFAGELHMVHANGTAIAVATFFLVEVRDDNPALAAFFAELPLSLCKTKVATFNPNALIAGVGKEYYTYTGSLTTPACTEGVQFFIYPNPIVIGSNQLKKLREFGDNARPIQSKTREVEVVSTP